MATISGNNLMWRRWVRWPVLLLGGNLLSRIHLERAVKMVHMSMWVGLL